MNRLIKGMITTVALVAALTNAMSAYADTYTYMCRIAHKTLPVTLDTDKNTITWRGTTFRDVKQVEGDCKAEYKASGVDLCTATQGVANLRIGKSDFECQMRK
jgi:hypothetical protein